MLFDPEPKRRSIDLFDFDNELKSLMDALIKDKLTLVTGLRRYGKTSLILTGLNESKVKYIYVDCRLLPDNPTVRDFIILIVNSGLSNSWFRRIIKRLDFIEVGALGIRVKLKRASEGLIRLIEGLGDMVLVLDEAQLLRIIKMNLTRLLAYIYDNTPTRLVLSGSEVGLLYDFLGIHDPESPLFGRAYREVRLRPLDRVKALDFLRLGFNQAGVKVSDDDLTRAVDELDGIIGWLTYFGYNYVKGVRDLDAIIDDASRLAASEVNKLLNIYGIARARYVAILNAVATLNRVNWSGIKNFVIAKLGRIPDTTLSIMLKNLEKAGLIIKVNGEYMITDPIIRKAILRGYIK